MWQTEYFNHGFTHNNNKFFLNILQLFSLNVTFLAVWLQKIATGTLMFKSYQIHLAKVPLSPAYAGYILGLDNC